MNGLVKLVIAGVIALFVVVLVAMYGLPRYNVWRAGLAGEAELAKAEQNRRIQVFEAQAKMDSAKLHAAAEIERAKGVAEANKIIADGLKGHTEYLTYLWIDKVANNSNREIIYVPTEANIPVMEAGRSTKPALEAKQ